MENKAESIFFLQVTTNDGQTDNLIEVFAFNSDDAREAAKEIGAWLSELSDHYAFLYSCAYVKITVTSIIQ